MRFDAFLTSILAYFCLCHGQQYPYLHAKGTTMTHDIAKAHTDALDDAADPAPTAESAATSGDISVREAVRRVLTELGPDAELDAVLTRIEAQFGLCPPRGTVQTYLFLARKDTRDSASGEPRRRGRPRKAGGNGHPPPAPSIDEVVEAVEILRDLSDRLGEDNLHRLLDAL